MAKSYLVGSFIGENRMRLRLLGEGVQKELDIYDKANEGGLAFIRFLETQTLERRKVMRALQKLLKSYFAGAIDLDRFHKPISNTIASIILCSEKLNQSNTKIPEFTSYLWHEREMWVTLTKSLEAKDERMIKECFDALEGLMEVEDTIVDQARRASKHHQKIRDILRKGLKKI